MWASLTGFTWYMGMLEGSYGPVNGGKPLKTQSRQEFGSREVLMDSSSGSYHAPEERERGRGDVTSGEHKR